MADPRPDPRATRLWNLQSNQRVVLKCGCGRIIHFLPGFLQRRYRVPSDTLVYDLQYRFKCGRCNSRDIDVSIEVDK